jgi:cobalt/nickel transport system ATP-binding protein
MDAIDAKQISYQYPDGTQAIDNLSLSIAEGEKVGIIGPNGSGKSTFVTLLNGVRKGSGSLKIFEVELAKQSLREIKELVGIVFQNPDDQLFCPTIFEDVSFGPLNQGLEATMVHSRVSQALADVGLEGFEKRSSFHLSFGERKLASIATVVAMSPRLIAMDEPTSNLDLAHRRKIIRWIQDNLKTIILTSHDLDMILETCDRTILLNRGKIVADGDTRKILYQKDLLEKNDLELPISVQIGKNDIKINV